MQMTLRPVFILIVFLLFSFGLSAKEKTQIRLTKHLKDSLKNEVETMLADDQKYRWMLMFGELDEQKIRDWRAKPDSVRFPRIKLVLAHKAGFSAIQWDSVKKLQDTIDSVNFFKLCVIIEKYGFPGTYLPSYKAGAILQHSLARLTTDIPLQLLKEEVSKGNMDAHEYTTIYDGRQMMLKLPELYCTAVYYSSDYKTQHYSTPADLEQTNKARKEIGLKKFKQMK